MARMFPARIPPHVRNDPLHGEECRVYEVFSDELSDRYSVFAWVSWILKDPRERAWDGEADFVIADPDRGLLVLEVKGGAIEREAAGDWFSTDRRDVRHPIEDPFEQAKRNRFRLLRKLEGQPGWRDHLPATWHAVVFPSVRELPARLGLAAPAEIVITSADFAKLERRLDAIFDYWQGQEGPTHSPGREGVARIAETLSPGWKLRTPLGITVENETRELDQLTAEQFQVLDILARNRRAVVHGGPGTGKTVVALEKAGRLARENFETLLTCFNRPLAASLAASAGDQEHLTVRCFHDLCYEWARKAGLDVESPETPGLPNRYFRTILPERFADALARMPRERFAAIVVDEGQDFGPTDRTALEMALDDREHSVLYVFQDESQGVYVEGEPWPLDGAVPANLPRNLRNTRAIHEAVCRISGDDHTQPGPVPGRPPDLIAAAGMAEQRDALRRTLHHLLMEEAILPRSVVVLTSTRRCIEALAPHLRVGPFALTGDHRERDRVLIESITRFKGLERPVAVLVGLEQVEYCRFDPLLAVGASRARSHLVVIGGDDVLAKFREPE